MQRFMTFRGEWFLDLSAGVPYRQQILIKNPDIPIVDVLLRQTVLDTPDIVGLQRFSFTFDRGNREYAFAFVAETTQGEFVASVEGGASRAPIFLLLLAGD